jgi:hypothetical protein
LLRAPRGLPLGFPLWPLRKRVPCFVSVFSSIVAPNCQPIEHTPACRQGAFRPEAPHGLAGKPNDFFQAAGLRRDSRGRNHRTLPHDMSCGRSDFDVLVKQNRFIFLR